MGDKPEVGADLYVDDAPHNVEALRETGNRVILFDAPYNQGVPGTRALDWTECEQMVLRDAATAGFEFQTSLPGMERGAGRFDR